MGYDGAIDKSVTPDCEDIERALRGDGPAYARLVRRYEAAVARMMWRFTRDRATLNELVHDVFVSAYKSLPGYRAEAPFEHWLCRIAARTGFRYWKRKARDREQRAALAALYTETVPAADAGPSEAAQYAYRMLATLPPKDRLVLTLMYLEDCDTREIAERMGWSQTLVKVRAHRARKKLLVQLRAAGYESKCHD